MVLVDVQFVGILPPRRADRECARSGGPHFHTHGTAPTLRTLVSHCTELPSPSPSPSPSLPFVAAQMPADALSLPSFPLRCLVRHRDFSAPLVFKPSMSSALLHIMCPQNMIPLTFTEMCSHYDALFPESRYFSQSRYLVLQLCATTTRTNFPSIILVQFNTL